LGIRSIALSQAYNFHNEARVVPYETSETLAPELLARLVEIDLPPGVFLNVNFPNCQPDQVTGTVVTNQGKLTHGLWVEQRADGRNFPYYWLRFGRESSNLVEGTDMAALRNKQISVTPLKLDLTAYEVRDSVARALA
ncbi:MAG: 5'/3'-nucleotidase SurE, partial [Rhizobiaceae bacterium]